MSSGQRKIKHLSVSSVSQARGLSNCRISVVAIVQSVRKFWIQKVRQYSAIYVLFGYAHCEGVSKDMYNSLNVQCTSLNNISYHCELNHCNRRVNN